MGLAIFAFHKLVGMCAGGVLPELEVGVHHPVGETFTANTDTLKHTVTGELVHHKVGVDETWWTTSYVTFL